MNPKLEAIFWKTLKPGDLCFFKVADPSGGLVEIIEVHLHLEEISFQQLNGTTAHGKLSATAYIDSFVGLCYHA